MIQTIYQFEECAYVSINCQENGAFSTRKKMRVQINMDKLWIIIHKGTTFISMERSY